MEGRSPNQTLQTDDSKSSCNSGSEDALQTRRRAFLSLSGLALSGIGAGISSGGNISSVDQSDENFDHVLHEGKWKIQYYDGYEDDAHQVADWLLLAETTLKDDDIYPHSYDLETSVKLHYPEDQGMWRMNAGHWFGDGEVTDTIMEMPTPSEHRNTGDQRERWYLSGIGHEYVHLPQLRDYRFEGSSDFLDTEWYTEGMAEYLANAYVLPAAGFDPDLGTSIDSNIRQGDGFAHVIGADEYAGGQRLFQFLSAKFGPDNVTAITRSNEPTVMAALHEDLGLSPIEFEEKWLEWAETNIGGTYERPLFSLDEFPNSDGLQTSTSSGQKIDTTFRDPNNKARSIKRDCFAPETTDDTDQYRKLSPDQFDTLSSVSISDHTTHDQFDDTKPIDGFTIHYYNDYENDAERVANWLQSMVTVYDNLYEYPSIHTNVYLYDEEEYGVWRLGAVPEDEIKMVTPSQSPLSGVRRDHWYISNIAIEYFTRLIDDQSSGEITFPDWFSNGAAKYIAREIDEDVAEHSRQDDEFNKLVDSGLAHLHQIGFGRSPGDQIFRSIIEYSDGLISGILNGEADTFSERMKNNTEIHPYHIDVIYTRWINENYPYEYDISPRISGGVHESGVNQELWDAVTDQNQASDDLTFQDIEDAIQSYQHDQTVDGMPIELQDLVDLIQWYQG